MCIMLSFCSTLCRQNKYFLIGLCLGSFGSLILISIIENDCLFNESFKGYSNDHLSPSRSLSSDSDKQEDEYEPRVNLAGKPKKAQKTPNLLNRPRYYSTELGIREKLFVGVLTSQHNVSTYGIAINKTVAHFVDKIMFFIDAPGPRKLNISMPGGIVGFTDTRQILKPFHMLKYIIDNFLDDFDFFYFMKDRTYVRAQLLYDIVHEISVSEDVHAGSGKNDEHTAFCSLDAGLLLSNSIIHKVMPHLDWCVKNAFSDSDDDNVGRCILHATSVACQDFVQVSLVQNKREIAVLRSSLVSMSNMTPGGRASVSWPIGSPPGNLPSTRFDVLRWDYFTEMEMFLGSDFSVVKKLKRGDKEDIQYVLNASIKYIENECGKHLQYRRLVNGYRRFDPARGMDYRLDLAFRDTTTGREIHKRLEICKPLGRIEVVPMPYVTENIRVNLVLPITADNKLEAIKFMENYARICMEKHDKTFLMLVLLYEPSLPGKGTKDDIFLPIKEMALSLSDRYKKDGSKIAWVSIKIPFSEIISVLEFAIADLVVRKFSSESLILLCHPNMQLRQDYLNRVRMNTISGWQVFSPIPFSEFRPDIVYSATNPQPNELEIDKIYGHFDVHDVSHMAFHAHDYTTARKQTEAAIPIVRSDRDIHSLLSIKFTEGTTVPTSLYTMFLQASNLHILRAVEPGLRLRYQERNCLSNDVQCNEARAFSLGNKSQLAQLILDFKALHTTVVT